MRAGRSWRAATLLALHANHGYVDGRQLLNEASITAMSTVTSVPGRRRFGLGWYRDSGERTDRVQHLGAGMGFYNVMRLDPHRGIGVVILSNTTRRWRISHLADAALALPIHRFS